MPGVPPVLYLERRSPMTADLCSLLVMRKTHALIQVAIALLTKPHERQWAYDIATRANTSTGVTHPMLARMLDKGWLTSTWEDPNTITDKRPPRRYYTLTDKGKHQLDTILLDARSDPRFTKWFQ